MDGEMTSLLPHDADAEMCVIGSIIVGGSDTLPAVRQVVRREDFYGADNAELYEILCGMADAQKPFDSVILHRELKDRGRLEAVGGAAYIGRVMHAIPRGAVANTEHYAQVVRDCSLRRRLIQITDRVRQVANDLGGADINAEIQEASHRLTELLERFVGTKITPISDIICEAYDQVCAGGVETVMTGIAGLDNIYGGIALGETVVIGARPSMGKSTLVKQIADDTARRGVPVGFISLEETKSKIGRNLLSASSGIDNNRLRRAADLNEDDFRCLGEAAGVYLRDKPPLFVHDRAFKIDDIEAIATVMKSRHGIKLLVTDHLAKVRVPKSVGRYEIITEASCRMSELHKRLNVAGIVCSQLNRGAEGRDDKRPTMADLRESGAIEQDADGIIFLHREDYYKIGDASYVQTGDAELIVAKWRDGVRGKTIVLKSDLRHQRFVFTPTIRPQAEVIW